MNKPHGYRKSCMLLRNLPYQHQDENSKGMLMTGGVLGKGRIVWVDDLEPERDWISAYVEGIGMVSVDPRCLVPAR